MFRKICKLCNKQYFHRNRYNKYCSPKCYWKSKKGKPTWNKGKRLSKKHIQNLIKSHLGKMKGIKNPRWKGGKYKMYNGYTVMLQPNHPFANKRGYIYQHRLIMEKYLGRYLTPIEKIHHLNSIKDDNRIENLILFPNSSEHHKFHWEKPSYKKYMSNIHKKY